MDLVSGLFHEHRPLARLLNIDAPSQRMLATLDAHALLRPCHPAPRVAPPRHEPVVSPSCVADDTEDPEDRAAAALFAAAEIHRESASPDVAARATRTAAAARAVAEPEPLADFSECSSDSEESAEVTAAPTPTAPVAQLEGFSAVPDVAILRSFDDIVPRLKSHCGMPRADAERILRGIYAYGFEEPAPVQRVGVLPIAGIGLGGADRDVVVCAGSGCGKTAAIAIGAVMSVRWTAEPSTPQVIVLTPTRELAEQTAALVDHIGYYFTVNGGATACGRPFIGGNSVQQDLRRLAPGSTTSPSIVVANVGRAGDLMRRGALKTAAVSLLVLDEADALLAATSANVDALYDVFRFLPRDVRVAAVGTTMGDAGLFSVLSKFMRKPVVCTPPVDDAASSAAVVAPPAIDVFAPSVKHYAASVSTNRSARPRASGQRDSREELDTMAETRALVPPAAVASAITAARGRLRDVGAVVVFAPSRASADFLADRLRKHGHRGATAFHAYMPQAERERVFADFRRGNLRVLVTTEQFGRGIDVPQVGAVVMAGMPADPVVYAHCAGRCGRFGRPGIVVSVCAVDAQRDAAASTAAAEDLGQSLRAAFPAAKDLTVHPLEL